MQIKDAQALEFLVHVDKHKELKHFLQTPFAPRSVHGSVKCFDQKKNHNKILFNQHFADHIIF